jgi:hypothetical protein
MKRFFRGIILIILISVVFFTLISNSRLRRREEQLREEIRRWKYATVLLTAEYLRMSGFEITISRVAYKSLEMYKEVPHFTIPRAREEIPFSLEIAQVLYSPNSPLLKHLLDLGIPLKY